MRHKLLYNFQIGLEALMANKLRSLLTSLGIILGVASVITMLAIGRGAKKDILERMNILGANNIIIKPHLDQEEGEVASAEATEKLLTQNKRYSPGLTLQDGEALGKIIPHVKAVNPEVVIESSVMRAGKKRTAKLVGVGASFFEIADVQLLEGNSFSNIQHDFGFPVCIIGYRIKSRFFSTENPIGKPIKVGNNWLTVIGVLKERNLSESSIQKLGIRDFNMDIYAPVKTVLMRYKDRAKVTERDIEQANQQFFFVGEEDDLPQDKDKSYHQLDQITLQVDDNKRSMVLAEVVARMLERRHNQRLDFEVIVPEQVIKSEQKTRDQMNFVLAAIALISLLVGGIGIMNIMLASVLERIREIGVRLSIGATRQDIVLQFLSESVAISTTGGLIGVFLGIGLAIFIEKFYEMTTIVSVWSVVVSFFFAFAVGLIFGIVPARRAAHQNPVESLRYE